MRRLHVLDVVAVAVLLVVVVRLAFLIGAAA